MNGQFKQFVERASEITGAYGNYQTAPANVNAETIAAGRCELVRQVLELFIAWAYQSGAGGILVNLSGNAIIMPGAYVPWSTRGKQRSAQGRPQLASSERAVVRAWLTMLRKDRNGRRPPFFYDGQTRRWCVDTTRHPSAAAALAWLAANPLTPPDYVYLERSLPKITPRGAKHSAQGSQGEPSTVRRGAKHSAQGSQAQ